MKTKIKKIGKNKKEIKKPDKKKDTSYAWISFILALLFWVPLINIFPILPASIYFGIKAMRKAKKEPKKYGGFTLAAFSIVWALISLIFGIFVFILTLRGIV